MKLYKKKQLLSYKRYFFKFQLSSILLFPCSCTQSPTMIKENSDGKTLILKYLLVEEAIKNSMQKNSIDMH